MTKPNPLIDHTVDHSASFPPKAENVATLSDAVKQGIEDHLAKYPDDQRISAIMPALTLAQNDNGGHLTPELIRTVADYIGIPNVAAEEVATFYSMYELAPQGKHKISICQNISCMLRGCDALIEHLEQKHQIVAGKVSKDQMFSLKKVECLGACGGAPMMQIGDQYYENLTPEKLDGILNDLAGQ